jgi:DNA-binding FadR family transcriptional regulator
MVHHILAEMAGNRLLQAVATALFRLTSEVILEVKPPKKVIHRTAEHAEIVRAVVGGEPAAAADAMQRHLEKMGERLVKLEGAYRKQKGLARMPAKMTAVKVKQPVL